MSAHDEPKRHQGICTVSQIEAAPVAVQDMYCRAAVHAAGYSCVPPCFVYSSP